MSDLNSLIDNLALEAKTSRPAIGLARSSVVAFGVIFLYGIAVFICRILHLRVDLAVELSKPLFAAEIFSLSLLILSSVFAAITVSFPDLLQKKWMIRIPIVSLIGFLAIMVVAWLQNNTPMVHPMEGIQCLACITGLSLLPAAFMFYKIKQMATIHPDYAGFLSMLCAFGLGALLLRLSEDTNSIIHIVTWHYAPIMVISFLGFIIGPKFLKW
jgi:hypothetical protein